MANRDKKNVARIKKGSNPKFKFQEDQQQRSFRKKRVQKRRQARQAHEELEWSDDV